MSDPHSSNEPARRQREPKLQPESNPESDPQKKLHQLLAGIWERSKATELDRVRILREAQAAAAAGKLDEPLRTSAIEAAHKLAGALGTFGLPRGTDLARQAETAFRGSSAAEESLRIAIVELGRLIESTGQEIHGAHSLD